MVFFTCEIVSDICNKFCCSGCFSYSICTFSVKQHLMHHKTVSIIISGKLKEIECPHHSPPHVFLLCLLQKKGYMFGVQYQREKCHCVVGGDDGDFEDGK